MKTKQPAVEPVPKRIAIAASYPFKFLDDLCAAYVQGYRVDVNGLTVMNAPAAYMVEMILTEEASQ